MRNQVYRYGNETYRLSNKGLRYILADHHPNFFNAANRNKKAVTTFFPKAETVSSIRCKIISFMD